MTGQKIKPRNIWWVIMKVCTVITGDLLLFWPLNGIWTHNHLICNRTINHLVKLAKWLSCVVSTYQYGAFDCMLLPCHVSDDMVITYSPDIWSYLNLTAMELGLGVF